MLKFKTIEKVHTNKKVLDLLSRYTYQVNEGQIRILKNTNLQFVKPTIYLITYPIKLTILEYKVNEISNKPFYIKEYNKKYNLYELKDILKELV